MHIQRKMTGAERKRTIIRAARPLFASKGFSGTTVRDIAKAAGISEALLYRHFSSKESLYNEISHYAWDVTNIISASLDKLKPGAEALTMYVHLLMRLIVFEVPGREEEQYWHERLMFRSMMADLIFARAHLNNILNFWEDRIRLSIEEAVKAGDMVKSPVDPINRMWFMHHLPMALNLCHLSDEPAFQYDVSMDELTKQASLFILRGMGMTDEAIKKYFHPQKVKAFIRQNF